MKATIYYNDGTTTVIDESEEVVWAHLKRIDLRSIARIEIGEKELPDTCVAVDKLEEFITIGLCIAAETLKPDAHISSVSWRRMAHNAVAVAVAKLREGCNAESQKS